MFRYYLLREYCSSSWFMYWLSSHNSGQEARASLLAFWLPLCSPQFHKEKREWSPQSLACKLEACASCRTRLIGRPSVTLGLRTLSSCVAQACPLESSFHLSLPVEAIGVHTPFPTKGWDWGKKDCLEERLRGWQETEGQAKGSFTPRHIFY